MTATLYLIVHKVRGEPALDVAIKMERTPDMPDEPWWIISTSGHRAYPAASWELSEFCLGGQRVIDDLLGLDLSRFPDHYPIWDDKPAAPREAGVRQIQPPTPEDL